MTADPTLAAAGLPVRYAARYTVATDVATTLTLEVDGVEGVRTIAFPEVALFHDVPVLGMRPNESYSVRGTLAPVNGGESLVLAPLIHTTEAPPNPFPTVTIPVSDPARIEPGYTLCALSTNVDGYIVAFDALGKIAYLLNSSTSANAVTLTAEGNLLAVERVGIRLQDLYGNTLRRYVPVAEEPGDIVVPYDDFHHEAVALADGSIVSLTYEHLDVPAYPTGYRQPFTYAPATIRNDAVVHFAADGSVLGEWWMDDLMDLGRIGFDAVDPSPSGALDWVHTNSVQVDDDAITVSLRHQDAILQFSRSTGALNWIFAPPVGFAPEFQPFVLKPTVNFVYPTHMHAVELEADGTLRMFDNGTDKRNTPYYKSGQDRDFSRVFEVRIDPVAMTVTPTAEFGQTSTGPLFAVSFGNADRLPTTDNRLAVFGTVPRITEYAPDGTLVWEMGISPGSWGMDRAIRVPSLYPPEVVVNWE